ncbi:MAG: phage major capsid protein [Acidobacteria bacterium]|nr:phage major capsid protein [Acidobacteriota bacterium]
MARIKTLRDRLTDATAAAEQYITTITRAAEADDRELTAEERETAQERLDAAKAIHDQIAAAEGDAKLVEQLKAFNEAAGTRTTSPADASPAHGKRPKSLGHQFVESAAYDFIRQGKHHGRTGWSTGAVELQAATLTSDPASGGDLILPDYQAGILPLLFRRLTIADLFAPGTTDSNLIAYMVEQTFTNAAATVAEGAEKPESTLIFDQRTDAVKKIAHWLPVTDEMLEDVSQIRSFIDARLRLGLDLTEEDQLLNGSGLTSNIEGVLNRDGLQTALPRGTDTNADVIFKQIMAVYLNAFLMPDAIVLNPVNWQTIVLAKNAAGDYYAGGPFQMPPVPRLWGLPVVPTPAIDTGDGLVGAFRAGGQVFRRSGVTVEASNSHADFFIKNLTAIRAEKRLALAIYRPGAFGAVEDLN